MTYYYRSGKRIAVDVTPSAVVLPKSDERTPIDMPGWQARELSPGYVLLVDQQLLDDPNAATNRSVESLGEITLRFLSSDRERDSPRRSPGTDDELRLRPTELAEVMTFPVVVNEEGDGLLFTTGDVIAQFKPSVPRNEIEAHARERGWSVERTVSHLPDTYVLHPNTKLDPFRFANELVENFHALFAHPVFIEQIPDRSQGHEHVAQAHAGDAERDASALPSAALFGQQWHLKNVGQNGALAGIDVDAPGAWQITSGSPNVVICIIDSGVESAHEVFRSPGKIVPGFDFADNDAAPEPQGSTHGTACAAVAAADFEGGRVVGIAPRCRILPIRRTEVTNHLALSEAIAWAADHGADVISCSWGIDGRRWILPDVVRSAFQYATSHGRNGAGCPIFWAAGNGDELVSDDEWASSEYTIAIAASTDQGTRASYSDFGPEVDLCAPSSGGANGITTAVNTGYTSSFGGTSSAAPLAAGVAALVLSIAPHTRWFEVRDVLQASARKIDSGGAQYDQRGHSVNYGYGQVDARQALLSIDARLEVQRATGTEALGPQVAVTLDYLRRTKAGQALIAYVGARRFAILEEIQRSPAFLEAIGGLIRLLADVGEKLSTGQKIAIPEASWTTIALAARTVMSQPPLAASSP
jgi:subtilisin family serine protease